MPKPEVSIEELVQALDEEFDRLRQEAADRAQEAGRGAALIGAAGALGFVSAGALGSLPLLRLRRALPAWQVALIVAGGTAVGAATLARMGLARLAAIAPKALEQEVEEAVEDVAGSV